MTLSAYRAKSTVPDRLRTSPGFGWRRETLYAAFDAPVEKSRNRFRRPDVGEPGIAGVYPPPKNSEPQHLVFAPDHVSPHAAAQRASECHTHMLTILNYLALGAE